MDWYVAGSDGETSRQNVSQLVSDAWLDENFDFDMDAAKLPHLPEQAASPVSVIDTFDQYVATVV